MIASKTFSPRATILVSHRKSPKHDEVQRKSDLTRWPHRKVSVDGPIIIKPSKAATSRSSGGVDSSGGIPDTHSEEYQQDISREESARRHLNPEDTTTSIIPSVKDTSSKTHPTRPPTLNKTSRLCRTRLRKGSSTLPDYSHVTSKVKQYIKDMKKLSNQTTPPTTTTKTTPILRSAGEHGGHPSTKIVILDEEPLEPEIFSLYSRSEFADELQQLRNELIGVKTYNELLEIMVLERLSRCAADRTLAALQLQYDNMTAMFAEKQNEIDRLRFYKDVKVNEEFTVTLKTKEEEMGRSRRSSVGDTSVASLRHTPSSSALVKPSHSPSRSSTPCNLIRATSTPIANPNITLADQFQSNVDLTRPYPEVEICQSRSTTRDERMDLGRTVDSGVADSMPEDTTLESWVKDIEVILRRMVEFAILEENHSLNQNEKTIIWHSIQHQYKLKCCQFPVLSSHWPARQSGLVLQELGQAIQVLASRYNLDLLPQGQSEVTLPVTSGPSGEKKTAGHPEEGLEVYLDPIDELPMEEKSLIQEQQATTGPHEGSSTLGYINNINSAGVECSEENDINITNSHRHFFNQQQQQKQQQQQHKKISGSIINLKTPHNNTHTHTHTPVLHPIQR
ncbi:hypothetical protein Pcinc_022096 [Petrolisthes cinctipes]|uniref:Uncharacterized protein n=1 Tax=Petrolisthes cinctipes TaxID=88211 RepID=A0AAE1KE67_PETCI|nr:hypothetical protein Pcinc_022096 [Petrolisthes cinctipes]